MEKDKKYKALYNRLRRQILKGDFVPGTILPSESELRVTYQVTQPTIRHALNLLVQERLIKKHHGKGSIVQPRPLGVGIISFEGHSVTSQNDNENIRTAVIKGPLIAEWPAAILFQPTDEEVKQGVILMERVRTVNGKPVFFEKLYLPNIKLKGFCELNLNNTSLYDMLGAAYQVSIKSSEQKITAIASDGAISKLLKIKNGSPVVRLDRQLSTNREGFHIYSTLFANTDDYMLHIK